MYHPTPVKFAASNHESVVERLAILGTGPEPAFDELVALAAHICDTPIAVISLVGVDQQWFKARLGFDHDCTPHDASLCERPVLTRQFFTVDDASSHPDCARSPLVQGEPHVKFYAGTPLFADDGTAIGTLAVMDLAPRLLDDQRRRLLESLGHQVEHLFSLCHAVHENSMASDDLIRQQSRLGHVLDTITQGVVVHAPDGSIQQANPAAERILGLTIDQIRGRTPIDPRWQTIHRDGTPLPGEDHPASVTLRTGAEVRDVMMGVARPDGARSWLLVNSSPIVDPTGRDIGAVATFSDVTDLTDLNDQLQISLGEITAAAQESAALMSAVSHDVRAPLAAIRMMTEILEDRADAISDEQRTDLIHRVRVEARRTEGVLADFVSANRVGAGLDRPHRQSVDLGELVRTAAREFSNDDHEVRAGHLRGDLLLWADRSQVERILDNLISNAIRHTPAGSRVVVNALQQGDAVELSVEDDGPGIADHEKSSVFGAYVRGEGSKDRPGTGLGLYLVQQFAQFHGGRAWCEDAPSGGARIVVLLPLRPQERPGSESVGSGKQAVTTGDGHGLEL